MDREDVIELYRKEREYQERAFGDYKKLDSLNVASFLNFVEIYLEKAKANYSAAWSKPGEEPDWFKSCKELDFQTRAPIKTYEYLIKIMALAGASLETFTSIDPSKWREEDIKDKWK